MKRALLIALFASLAIVVLAQSSRPPSEGCEPGSGTQHHYPTSYATQSLQQLEEPIKVDYRIYPNPVSDFFSLDDESAEKGAARTISIYNLVGQRVQTFQVEKQQRYNVADLPTGLYLVQFLDAKNKVVTTRRLNKASSVVRP